MKIVLDTNVLVSGIFWGGHPRDILDLWNEDKVQLLVSEEILSEYSRVITSFGEKHHKQEDANAWLWFIAQNTTIIKTQTKFRLCRDPEDNKYLDCAIASRAKFIVTGDKDLLTLKNIMDIDIITPKKFLDLKK